MITFIAQRIQEAKDKGGTEQGQANIGRILGVLYFRCYMESISLK